LEENVESVILVRQAWANSCTPLKGLEGSADWEALFACGESALAAERASHQFPPEGTDAQALTKALTAFSQRQPQQAIRALESVRRITFPAPTLRGLAYLELKRPAEAAQEFRKQIARKSQLFEPTYAVSHVHLARALAAAGQTAEAKQTYEKFFELWRNADPGIPLLDQARKEYASLR
jgi:tetratricopeptide (TPR) repeat protein